MQERAWQDALKWYQAIAEKMEKNCETSEDYETLYFILKQILKNEIGEN